MARATAAALLLALAALARAQPHFEFARPAKPSFAYDLAAECAKTFDALFSDFDVVVAPAAPGEAPEGLHTTGDWVFNAMFTVMHMPCLAIPCIKGPKGLPVGIQIVGPRFSDARLLAIGAAVAPVIDADGK